MKKYIYAFLLCLLIPLNAQSNTRYAVTLISLIPENIKKDRELLQEDRRSSHNIIMKHLKPYCRFFDEDVYRRRIDDMYRQNPDLDPTDVQNKLAALSLPTKLIVLIEVEVKSLQDFPFEHVYRHQAEINIKVVDKSGWSEIYAQTKGKTPKLILDPPLQGSSVNDWRINRRSRDRAIEEAIKLLIPNLITQLTANKDIINGFDFLAIRLFGKKKTAMWRILDEINISSVNNTKIQDLKHTTDQGIAAKIICENGISAFIQELSTKFSKDPFLHDMQYDTDGIVVKVYPKEAEPDLVKNKEKFEGLLVITPDIEKINEKKSTNAKEHEENQKNLKQTLWENMQGKFRIFDAGDLWKNLKNESIRTQSFATVNPTDYVAKKNNMATHTLFYWSETFFKKEKQQKYCFAKLGIRLVRMVTMETIVYHELTSEEEFKRGVMVTRDETHARREAINLLGKRVISKVILLLLKEENFSIFYPRINIVANNFSNDDIDKLKNILTQYQQENKIKIENLHSGDSFLKCEIVQEKESQTLLRQSLIEYAEVDELMIKVQSERGKLYLTPMQQKDDE